jgi:cytochrome c5
MKKTSLGVVALAASLSTSFAAQKPMSYTGEIRKDGGKFVLVDNTTNVVYQMDNQKKPKDFAGDKVVVSGTLDPTSKTIHVRGIRTAPGVQNTAEWGER